MNGDYLHRQNPAYLSVLFSLLLLLLKSEFIISGSFLELYAYILKALLPVCDMFTGPMLEIIIKRSRWRYVDKLLKFPEGVSSNFRRITGDCCLL
jgi:hypothetical protein